MTIPKVSIRSLMVVVLVIAVATVALMRPTRLWAASIFFLTFAAFTVVTLGAIFARGRVRASYIGFAIGGWLILMLHFSPLLGALVGNSTGNSNPTVLLPTTAILDLIYPYSIAEPSGAGWTAPVSVTGANSAVTLAPPTSPIGSRVNASPIVLTEPERYTFANYWTFVDRVPFRFPLERLDAFLVIGYSLFCLLFAALTSLLAARTHASWSEPLPKPSP